MGIGDKYELLPEGEGDLFRIRALRDIREYMIVEGELGGLVQDVSNLDQDGNCWIWPEAKVTGDAQVRDHARVTGHSVLSDMVDVSGCARVWSSQLSGCVVVTGEAFLGGCKVTGQNETVLIGGSACLEDCVVESAKGHGRIYILTGKASDAHIRSAHEILAYHHQVHGWLTAFRGLSGGLQYRVGCQALDDADDLRCLAMDYDLPAHERAMLEGFIAMVDAARGGWVEDSKSGEDVPAAAPPAPVVPPEAELLNPSEDIGN